MSRSTVLTIGSSLLPLALAVAAASLFTACGPPTLSESAKRGRQVFMEDSKPHCVQCHKLMDASPKNSAGPKLLGPDMDIKRPSRAMTIKAVTQGVGIMPAQKGILTKQQIEDVAEYLAEVAGR